MKNANRNLAVYLMKHEVKKIGRPAIVANHAGRQKHYSAWLRRTKSLKASLIILAVKPDGKLERDKNPQGCGKRSAVANPPYVQA